MSSHALFPALDREPATFSPKITRALLRERLGFRGCVISDDLCMGAVTKTRSVQAAALDALAAGHDLLIIAHDIGAMWEAPSLLEAAAAAGRLAPSALAQAERRAARLLEAPGRPARASAEEGARLAAEIASGAAEQVQRGALKLPLRPDSCPTVVVFPDFREVRERFTFEGGPLGPERLLKRRLSLWGRALVLRAPVESSDVRALARGLRGAGKVLFLCFEAMRFPGQKAALELLKKTSADKTAVCLIRNTADKLWLAPAMSAVDAYGYRHCQLEAALDLVLGRKP